MYKKTQQQQLYIKKQQTKQQKNCPLELVIDEPSWLAGRNGTQEGFTMLYKTR